MSGLLSSIDHPTALRARADLLASPVETAGAITWVVKDPLTLEHFQFSAEEHALLQWLRVPRSIANLQRLFQKKFSPQTITPQAIWDFMSRLHSAGLLVSDSVGQGRELLARRDRDRLRKLAFSWTGLLAIRFPGIDPDRFLTALHAAIRWLFSPAAVVVASAIVLYASSLIIGHFNEFQNRLPELSALVDWHNLPWLLAAIGGVKVLHELGHALACKHFGGEVREMGLMLLVFAPCLYCDVTDAWRFGSKGQRIAVSSAGVVVELLLAALATIVWWHALPGVLQLIALNIMIVCTVNTLFINGNPLLRYDGYFIFSDLVEVPNLWQRSREALRHFWSEWLMGQPTIEDQLLATRHRPWLTGYALLSKAYLAIMCVMIVWGLAQSLSPYRLENLAYAVGLAVVASALVGPISNAAELVRNPIRRAEVRQGRLALIAAVGLAALVGVLLIPVDYKVAAPLVLMPEDADRVYATVEGTLVEILPPGAKVAKGDAIGRLENPETTLEIARLEGECALRKMRVEHLERLRGFDHQANDQLPTARTALADSERRLEELRKESQRLTLIAPQDGFVIQPPRRSSGEKQEGRLATWSGSLLDPVARGAHVEAGTLTCVVGDPRRLVAVLLVDEADVRFVAPGQPVRISLDEAPGHVLAGKVVEVARRKTDESAGASLVRADLAPLFAGLIDPSDDGARFEVLVRFDSADPLPLVIGGRGEAKVVTERITLGRRIYRALAQTFRLPM